MKMSALEHEIQSRLGGEATEENACLMADHLLSLVKNGTIPRDWEVESAEEAVIRFLDSDEMDSDAWCDLIDDVLGG